PPGSELLRGAIAIVPAALGGLLGAVVRSRSEPSVLERIADDLTPATGVQAIDFGAIVRASRVLFPIVPAIVGLAPLAAATHTVGGELLVAVVAIGIEALWFLLLRALPLFEVA
ncbi:MAG: hypothetical protein WAM30_08070, partial [Candidatus Dormiibacterota bacterium]